VIMKPEDVTQVLCCLANIIIRQAGTVPIAPFGLEAIHRAADGKRLLDFIGEVTGQDDGLSWIRISRADMESD